VLNSKDIIKELRESGIESPALDARLLLSYLLKISVEKIIIGDFALTEAQQNEYQKLIARRKAGEPVAYIIGKKEFYGREFKVTRDTLIPRPDSETIIDAALGYFALTLPSPVNGRGLKILDLGTGTGCLLLTLLKEFPHSSGFGVDISGAALIVARENSVNLGLGDRVEFVSCRWGEESIIEELGKKFDLIVSNPPYIRKSDFANLALEVKNFEPHVALDGGEDGVFCYRELLPQVARMLEDDGIALIEIGKNQKPDLLEIINKNNLSLVAAHKDLAGIERCLLLKKI